MKRKIYNQLLSWKNSQTKQAFMIQGARQIGKTYIIKEFGKNEFENTLYINFEDQLDLKSTFSKCENPDTAIKLLQAYGISKSVFSLSQNKTLIFLDEIQLCKRMYSLLKPLCELDKFRFIVSGSLLGINLGGDYLDPGPIVIHKTMHPMDLEEYIWAKLGDESVAIIDSVINDSLNGTLIPEPFHVLFNNLLKEYIVVGGMPKVVLNF